MSGYKALIGKAAPQFKLKNYDGNDYEVKPGEKGIPLVIFFYPQAGEYASILDRTQSGRLANPRILWVHERSQFRDAVAEKVHFSAENVEIVGVSPDTVEKQEAFVKSQKLTYPVLSDVSKEVAGLYGVGKGMWGLIPVARVTFVIDKKGVVRDALEGTMNYGAHTTFVEKWLKTLKSEA